MFMKYNDQLIKLHHIFKYFLIIMICFHISNSNLANPKKIIKNVICKEKSIITDFLENSQNEKRNWFGLYEDGSTITKLFSSS